MSNPEDVKGNGEMQGEKPSGVSSCSVGLRGFESHPPHFSCHRVQGEERILRMLGG
jgi:hypothetical protein